MTAVQKALNLAYESGDPFLIAWAEHLADVLPGRDTQRPEREIAGERIDILQLRPRRSGPYVEEDELRHLAQQTERIIAVEKAVGLRIISDRHDAAVIRLGR